MLFRPPLNLYMMLTAIPLSAVGLLNSLYVEKNSDRLRIQWTSQIDETGKITYFNYLGQALRKGS